MEGFVERFVRLSNEDGTWGALKDQWAQQLKEYGEDVDTYETSVMPVLQELIVRPERNAGVFAQKSEDGKFDAACQLNSALLPGYTGKVLRARMMVLSPEFEYGEYPIEKYINTITGVLLGAFMVSYEVLPSEHIKFHLRSPADRQFFAMVGASLRETDAFASVQTRGSWLYITKNKPPQG